MARDTTDNTPLTSHDQLVYYFQGGIKPASAFKIGTEHEKFAFFSQDNTPVPYEGARSISALLNGMADKIGWEPIMDAGKIIGLAGQQGGAISLEPGGQFELSGAPLDNIHQTCAESNQHLRHLREVAEPMGIKFVGLGGSPKWTFDETPRMPKSRYDIMSKYMPKVGTQGLDMMYRTCTIQVNLDFDSEQDMAKKMRVGMALQPLATAFFASSPFTDGKPNGLLSWRGNIWRDTDNARAGILPDVFSDNYSFEHYAQWALDVPMYFILRDGTYYDATHVTFRQFLDGALDGDIPDAAATMGDWTNHLSTVFPDVRLKRFIEMRGADGGPWQRICALPALWVGLLYDQTALSAAEDLVKDWSYEDVLGLRDQVPRDGLQSQIAGHNLLDIARDVVDISASGLKARAIYNETGSDESYFLNPLWDVVRNARTPSENLLALYHGPWDKSVEPLFEEMAY